MSIDTSRTIPYIPTKPIVHLEDSMTDTTLLKTCLDSLAGTFDAGYIDTDPVSIVHRYNDSVDREVVGLIVSALAYGGTEQIKRSADAALAPAGSTPAAFIRELTSDSARSVWRRFKHRWTDTGDLSWLALSISAILKEYGSIGALVRSLDNPDEPTVGGVMTRLVEQIRGMAPDTDKIPKYLLPSPADGSACKRLAMYFRWMVRGPDSIDFGIWDFISPARLIIPVDRHIARMAKLLQLTQRTTADWKMALEITDALRKLDPSDPVRYDFALVRPGITGDCRSSDPAVCRACAIAEICAGNTQ